MHHGIIVMHHKGILTHQQRIMTHHFGKLMQQPNFDLPIGQKN
jgi:hypothetical protein